MLEQKLGILRILTNKKKKSWFTGADLTNERGDWTDLDKPKEKEIHRKKLGLEWWNMGIPRDMGVDPLEF